MLNGNYYFTLDNPAQADKQSVKFLFVCLFRAGISINSVVTSTLIPIRGLTVRISGVAGVAHGASGITVSLPKGATDSSQGGGGPVLLYSWPCLCFTARGERNKLLFNQFRRKTNLLKHRVHEE